MSGERRVIARIREIAAESEARDSTPHHINVSAEIARRLADQLRREFLPEEALCATAAPATANDEMATPEFYAACLVVRLFDIDGDAELEGEIAAELRSREALIRAAVMDEAAEIAESCAAEYGTAAEGANDPEFSSALEAERAARSIGITLRSQGRMNCTASKPELVWVGEEPRKGTYRCSFCDAEADRPHAWKQCAEVLKARRDELAEIVTKLTKPTDRQSEAVDFERLERRSGTK